jgi:hypothetical protein
MIYAWMLPLQETESSLPFLYLAKDEVPILTTDRFDFIIEKEEVDVVTGKSTARDIMIKSQNIEGIQLQCHLHTKRVVEHGKLPQSTDWPQYNWRFLADYQAEIKAKGITENVTGETIHECLILK